MTEPLTSAEAKALARLWKDRQWLLGFYNADGPDDEEVATMAHFYRAGQQQQAARIATWEAALHLIKGALSPSPCPATTCEGCRIDWETALDAACEALEDRNPTEVGDE